MGAETTDHDGAYKKLFSSKEMVRALIAHHFDWEMAQELDFDAMRSLNVEFRAGALNRRDGDMIWEIPAAGGDRVYVMLMLEFQSRVDPTMAIRVLLYTALLYDHLLTQGLTLRDDSKLPPVLPVVLYNGRRTWNAPRRTLECIDLDAGSPLGDYQPDLSYYLIDIGRLERATDLSELTDPVSLLFELERVRERSELADVLEHMADVVGPNGDDFFELFAYWFTRVFVPREGIEVSIRDFTTLNRESDMLRETVERWYREAATEGRAEGLAEGREEGREEGRLALFERLLTVKFGPSEERRERLAKLTPRQLDVLGERLMLEPETSEQQLFTFTDTEDA
jgi:predicted transposase YdaD